MSASRFAVLTILAAALCPGAAHTVHAQGYPERPIKLVVPFPAGGATDTTARLIAQRLQASLGQTVIVENQGGAGGTIGTKLVANAPPDGYTLLMGSIGTFGSQPLLYKLDYDPQKAFAPVATAVVDKGVLVAGPSLQVKTVQELVAYAKANPGKLNYGSAIGIGPHLVAELFKIKSGTNIVHIPYRGGAPMISDLIAGQIRHDGQRQVGPAAAHPGRQGARARRHRGGTLAGAAGCPDLGRSRIPGPALRHLSSAW